MVPKTQCVWVVCLQKERGCEMYLKCKCLESSTVNDPDLGLVCGCSHAVIKRDSLVHLTDGIVGRVYAAMPGRYLNLQRDNE